VVEISVSVKGETSVLDALDSLILGRRRKKHLLNFIGVGLVESTQQRFIDQVDPDGVAWVPSIRALHTGGKTLMDTLLLLSSITYATTTDDVYIGTDVPYARPLQEGAHIQPVVAAWLIFNIPGVGWFRKKEVDLPPRPFLGFSAHDEDLITDILYSFMQTFGQGSGKGNRYY